MVYVVLYKKNTKFHLYSGQTGTDGTVSNTTSNTTSDTTSNTTLL